jgi:hypothetical protein
MAIRLGAALIAAVLAATPSASQSPPTPTLPDVLARAGAYVARFERDLSGIAAKEAYTQELHSCLRASVRRDLTSDLLLIRPAGYGHYLQFRDVYEVDGTPVRDRHARLLSLFARSPASAFRQAARIMAESARFNIGSIRRNINVPVLPLEFLAPANQPRSEFSVAPGDDDQLAPAVANSATFRASTELWVVTFREVAPHTLIRTTSLADLPARGRFWIEPATGRVRLAELTAQDRDVRGTIEVSYQSEPLLGLLVPIEMRETYQTPSCAEQITGRATYSDFRRLGTGQAASSPDPR